MSEPWRYKCPECGSHVIKKNIKVGTKRPGRDKIAHKINQGKVKQYRCHECGAHFDHPVDKKNG